MKEFFAQTDIKRILKYALYLFLTLVTQNMLLTQIRPLGICPLVLPAVAVSVGMFLGPSRGVIFSIILGFFADMGFVENNILFTVLLPVLSFGTSLLTEFYINRRFFAFMGLALAASLLTGLVQALLTFAGDSWSGELLKTALLQTLFSLPISAAAYLPPAKWIR